MDSRRHIIRVAIGTGLYACLIAIVLWFSAQSWPEPRANGRRLIVAALDRALELPREPTPACETLRPEASGVYQGVRLVIEGMDSGLDAIGCKDGPAPSVIFQFQRKSSSRLSDAADEAVWNRMLRRPLDSLRDGGRILSYDLQWSRDGVPVRHLADGAFQLKLVIFQWWSPAASMVVLYVWAVLIYLAAVTALIRDPAPAAAPLVQRTFSLGKAQMAWWFAIVFAAWIFLWLVTGEVPSVSGQALALLGISTATTLASSGVSATQLRADGQRGEFFVDLLSDEHGIAIHRFQMLVLTIALGLMFLFDVATKLTMPVFDPSLLTLMGLSAATYVGLKLPEKAAPP